MLKFSKRAVFLCQTARTPITLGLTLGLTLAAAEASPPPSDLGGIVQTGEGLVQGFFTKGVKEFLGIPYAAPPVGDLRWRPPASHARWTEVLQTISFGSNCPQIETTPFAGPSSDNEDCLFLNLFTPDLNGGGKLPVIVWLHGGGNSAGESADYDGSKLAAQGHTVVVTLNYRLGLLGFMAHPALNAEDHLFANYGILGQQFALQWVKANIANSAATRIT